MNSIGKKGENKKDNPIVVITGGGGGGTFILTRTNPVPTVPEITIEADEIYTATWDISGQIYPNTDSYVITVNPQPYPEFMNPSGTWATSEDQIAFNMNTLGLWTPDTSYTITVYATAEIAYDGQAYVTLTDSFILNINPVEPIDAVDPEIILTPSLGTDETRLSTEAGVISWDISDNVEINSFSIQPMKLNAITLEWETYGVVLESVGLVDHWDVPPNLGVYRLDVSAIDTSGNDASSSSGSIIIVAPPIDVLDLIEKLIDAVDNDGCIKNQQAMLNKLAELYDLADNKMYAEAYDKLLHDIKPKLTGLKEDELGNIFGDGTFKNPWACASKFAVYEDLCNAILTELHTLL